MKKILLFLSIILTTFTIVGCSNNDEKPKTEKQNVTEKKSSSNLIDDQLEKAKKLYKEKNYEGSKKILSSLDDKKLSTNQKKIKEKLEKYISEEISKIEESKQEPTEVSNPESSTSNKKMYLDKINAMEQSNESIDMGYTTSDILNGANQIYKNRDDMLNEIWAVLKNTLTSNEMSNLTTLQVQWIKNRDINASQFKTGGSSDEINYVDSQSQQTLDRCYELVNGYMK